VKRAILGVLVALVVALLILLVAVLEDRRALCGLAMEHVDSSRVVAEVQACRAYG
jgi:hypothetical protein